MELVAAEGVDLVAAEGVGLVELRTIDFQTAVQRNQVEFVVHFALSVVVDDEEDLRLVSMFP